MKKNRSRYVLYFLPVFIGLSVILFGCKAQTTEKASNVILGDQKFAEGKYEEANQYYSNAIQNGDDLDKAYIGRGNVYSQWRRFDQAIVDYTSALQLRRSVEALSGRCIAYRLLGKFEAAQTDCNEAISLDPNSTDARLSLASLYLEQDDLGKAESILNEALQKDMQSSKIYFMLYQLEKKRGNYEKALELISSSINYDQNQAQFYCERGALNYSLANIDQARKDFQKAVEVGIDGKDDECLFQAQTFLQFFGTGNP